MPKTPEFVKDPRGLISDLFRGVDPSVLDDNERLERIQKNCQEQQNPFACYFTLLLGADPKITWRHQTVEHFGVVDLSYNDVFTLVHPSWLLSYMYYGRAMYELAHQHPEFVSAAGASAASLVPLRHKSGKYYWYHQISVSVALDGPQLAAHLNYYHQGLIYEAQLPSIPVLTTNGEANLLLMQKLAALGRAFLPSLLREYLSESQIKFMLAYRKILTDFPEGEPSQRQLLEQIVEVGSIENLNKIKQRIKKSAQTYYQHPGLSSARALGTWLNRYFPLAYP